MTRNESRHTKSSTRRSNMKSAVSSFPEATGRSSFKAERVQLQLSRLAGWKAIETRTMLIGTYHLGSDTQACALAGAMGSLFGERRKGSVSVVQNRLTVRVESPLEREIAQGELNFAKRVDRLVGEFRKGWESR
jgi:hypothetical protein